MNATINTMLKRRSCRKYTNDPVREADLEQILLAGTYAASGMGRQAAKIVVVQDPTTREQLRKMNAAVMGNPDRPVLRRIHHLCRSGRLGDRNLGRGWQSGHGQSDAGCRSPGRGLLLDSPGQRGI